MGCLRTVNGIAEGFYLDSHLPQRCFLIILFYMLKYIFYIVNVYILMQIVFLKNDCMHIITLVKQKSIFIFNFSSWDFLCCIQGNPRRLGHFVQ